MLILNSLIGSKQKKIKTVILLNKIYFVKTVCRRTIIFLFKNYIKMKGKKKKNSTSTSRNGPRAVDCSLCYCLGSLGRKTVEFIEGPRDLRAWCGPL